MGPNGSEQCDHLRGYLMTTYYFSILASVSTRLVRITPRVMLAMIFGLSLAGCAPGNPDFQADPAGFWAGLWHGLIMVFTFLVSLFNDGVRIYETANTGSLYNLGFVIGAMIFFGGCGGRRKFQKWRKNPKDQEWEDISEKVEDKIRKGIQSWLDEASEGDEEWKEIAGKIEEKIKRELRKWAEK